MSKYKKNIIFLKGDPTKTITLRNNFVSQFKTRFNSIIRESNRSIILNDCFGLSLQLLTAQKLPFSPSETWKDRIKTIPKNKFRYDINPEKISGFMEWLNEMEKEALFQVINFPKVGPGINPIWTNIYITTAYKRGILWARTNIRKNINLMNKLGLTKESLNTDSYNIGLEFETPVHADRAGSIYIRTYNDLEGITSAMDAQISRTLSEGLILGKHPKEIAKEIASRIRSIGIHRATLLARTEIIRAHHLASIQTYRNFGIEEVEVMAEWITAGDSRVCELCAPLQNKTFTLDEIEGLIPLHPQCRCAAIPIVTNNSVEFGMPKILNYPSRYPQKELHSEA